MTTYHLNVALSATVSDDPTSTDTEALPRFINLVEVREVLDIKLTDVRGGV